MFLICFGVVFFLHFLRMYLPSLVTVNGFSVHYPSVVYTIWSFGINKSMLKKECSYGQHHG